MTDIWILCFQIIGMVQPIILIPIFIGAQVVGHILQEQNLLVAGHIVIL
ncbi:hypothetical protein OMAG_000001 [Candidatus Omnitrophus magneticus]|uniref:Uncharacterized protein n=1 Tax=Candidatus Omnitrophus magneticus TaxID=1609969 RepID=A0A0F0CVR6_9BACT|nr:hypothetical protein OMAG_000001 [Candidatus Omnitrophus magneticus]